MQFFSMMTKVYGIPRAQSWRSGKSTKYQWVVEEAGAGGRPGADKIVK
jgi:hypothetical protein